MDSVLKTILQLLEPLASSNSFDSASSASSSASGSSSTGGFLCSRMDLPLISWLLLFLSQCLDSQPNFYLLDDMPDKIKNWRNNGKIFYSFHCISLFFSEVNYQQLLCNTGWSNDFLLNRM